MPNLDSAKASTKASLGAGKERLSNSRVRHPTKFFKKDTGPEFLDRAYSHQSTPLRQLKDPDTFGPPPRTNTAGLSLSSDRPRPPSRSNSSSDSTPRLPPAPYRQNTTGIDPTNLPKPPTRNADPNVPPPKPPQSARPPPPAVPARSQPALPPRLPQRASTLPAGSLPAEQPPELPPPPAYAATDPLSRPLSNTNAQLNERTPRFKRLPPAFSTPTRSPSPPLPSRSNTGTSTPSTSDTPAPTSAPVTVRPLPPPSTAIPPASTWQDKRDAVANIAKFRQDPASVSREDALSTASTVRNFQQRNGESIAPGFGKANALAQRGEASSPDQATGDEAGSGAGSGSGTGPGQGPIAGLAGIAAAAAGKKPPPPPPPVKRRGLAGASVAGLGSGAAAEQSSGGVPPPVPLGSKPRS